MKKKKAPGLLRLRVIFILSVALVLFVTIVAVILIAYILAFAGVLNTTNLEENWFFLTSMFILASVLIGLFLTFCTSKIVMKPINSIIEGMDRLSNGDYTVRIKIGKYGEMKHLSDGFNNLANELENTEILRSDFINNFSHELKTPVVSISGLIKLLNSEDISEEKRKEYLKIIEEEASRLSTMTTNVLMLSKIENQSILYDKKEFNLSEEIRTCVLLLENKWMKKNLESSLDFDEFNYFGSEDLLKQVWINLIDNAINFSYEGTELIISISQNKENTTVEVTNFGEEISQENKEKIFNKFYQVDTTHSSEGNGIGLSIVKHIVDLHLGEIEVNCEKGKTTFRVILPM